MATTMPAWGEIFQVPPNTTADDLLRLPDDGYKYELYEGMLVREMTSPSHGAICQRIGYTLGQYAEATGFIKQDQIVQNVLFDLAPPNANRAALAPDVAILRATTALSWSVPRDTPLLAVEVVSAESQTLAELALKAQEYRRAGVDEVWVVDARSRAIEVWSAAGMTTLDDAQTLTSALLPGFAVTVRHLLDGRE